MAFFGLFGRGGDTANATIKVNYNGGDAQKGLKKLQSQLKDVISTFALAQIAKYTTELANLGAKAESVEKNFESFARARNRTVDSMMTQLRKATLGMVSDMELQQQAMKAMISGVKFDDMITAMEFVTKFAAATGTDVNQKMTTVMTGMARKSAMFFDDVGIQVMGASDVVGAAVEQMREKMGQFALSEDDAAVKAAQLEASFKTMKQNIGKLLVPAFEELIKLTNETIDGWSSLRDIAINKFSKAAKNEKKTIDIYTEAIREMATTIIRWRAQIGVARSRGMNDWADEQEKKMNRLIEAMKTAQGLESKARGVKPKGQPIDPKEKTSPEAIAALEKQKFEAVLERMQDEQDAQVNLQKWFEERGEQERQAKWDLNNRIVEDRENAEARVKEIIGTSYRQQIEQLGILRDQVENDRELDLINHKQYREAMKAIDDKYNALRVEAWSTASAGMLSSARSAMNLINANDIQYYNAETKRIRDTAKTQEEYDKRVKKLQSEMAERQAKLAVFNQTISFFQAMSNAIAAAAGASRDTPGGAFTRIASAMSVMAEIGALAGTISALNMPEVPSFQNGRIGNRRRSRGNDSFMRIDRGEAIISAPQAAMHEDTLQAIADNTANTASGLNRMGSGGIVNNYYGVTTEQMLQAQTSIDRRRLTGRRI